MREGDVGRELVLARWGMPSPVFALKGKKVDAGVTNIRNVRSAHGRRWLGPENRCLAPFTSFSENELTPGGSKRPIWFAFDEARPLAFFAGVWTRWTSTRRIKEWVVSADLFRPSDDGAEHEVAIVHPQAMPAILATEEEREVWLRAWSKASALQPSLPNGSLQVVLRSEKQDAAMDLANFAAQARRPHAPLPLPLLAGKPDRPDDATTAAVVDNMKPSGV